MGFKTSYYLNLRCLRQFIGIELSESGVATSQRIKVLLCSLPALYSAAAMLASARVRNPNLRKAASRKLAAAVLTPYPLVAGSLVINHETACKRP